jgi:hypothetical protein
MGEGQEVESLMPARKNTPRATPAREVIAAAAVELGGVERLVGWVKEDVKNEGVFWGSLFPKLIALQSEAAAAEPVAYEVVVRFV